MTTFFWKLQYNVAQTSTRPEDNILDSTKSAS